MKHKSAIFRLPGKQTIFTLYKHCGVFGDEEQESMLHKLSKGLHGIVLSSIAFEKSLGQVH